MIDNNHLDLCQNIEFSLKKAYETDPKLTDTMCIFGLASAKIAIKKQFGFAKNETVTDMPEVQLLISSCVEIGLECIGKVNDLTLKEYTSQLDKIRKSVIRHSYYGARGYYEFIRKFV